MSDDDMSEIATAMMADHRLAAMARATSRYSRSLRALHDLAAKDLSNEDSEQVARLASHAETQLTKLSRVMDGRVEELLRELSSPLAKS